MTMNCKIGRKLPIIHSSETSVDIAFRASIILPFILTETAKFASYIKKNAPLVFTKENIDPWICGNHADRCGTRVSEVYQVAGVPIQANGQSCNSVDQCNDETFG